jgi:hypothetical protein
MALIASNDWNGAKGLLRWLVSGALTCVIAEHAVAGDLTQKSAAASEAPAVFSNALSLEVSPEVKANNGDYSDTYLRGAYAHTFGNGLIWGASVQYTFKPGNDDSVQGETTLGYRWHLNEIWSVPFNGGIGYYWDQQSSFSPSQQFAYYVFNLGLDMKINANWTWNVVSARYRDAFEGGWQTPKVISGFTYAVDRQNAVFVNVGYSWKNGAPSTITFTGGYNVAF